MAPALGEVFLKGLDGTQTGGRLEGVGECRHRGDPVHAQDAARVARVRPAEQIPAAVVDDDRPWVDLHGPLAARAKPVAEAQAVMCGGGLDERGGGVGVG
ncbi:hypothetical protein, partial [Streptomyces sp. T21Q-yed]|uniref:hypothetical protein n=1 Tax=Streptomyces sp. T21Q-yed TaxID=3018441 RepID=UPI0023E0201F